MNITIIQKFTYIYHTNQPNVAKPIVTYRSYIGVCSFDQDKFIQQTAKCQLSTTLVSQAIDAKSQAKDAKVANKK